MDLHTWIIYLLAATGLSLSPGPNGLLALTHGALYGSRRTLWTISGGVIGFAILIGASIFGIGVLLQASATALTVMKWLGGAYLVWLGIQLWRAPPIHLGAEARSLEQARGGAMFRQGLLTAVSNPKALLFYGAFLPQFIDPARPLGLQFGVMATTFVLVEILVEVGLAMMAHRIRHFLQRAGKTFNRVCGGLFMAMGVAMPLTR